MSTIAVILLVLSLLLVLASLFGGLVSMVRGGPGAPQRSNKFMRLRVMFQFIAIVLFGLALALAK